MPKKYCVGGAPSRTNEVLDVSRYIVNYCREKKGCGISNLQLQNILYFVQAYFLITKPYTACFNRKIEAWDFGPIVPAVHYEFRQYKIMIPYIKPYAKRDANAILGYKKVRFNENVIPAKDKKKIRDVVDYFCEYSTSELTSLTKNQKPWKDAFRKGAHSEITQEAIRAYFNNKKADYVRSDRHSELVHRIQ